MSDDPYQDDGFLAVLDECEDLAEADDGFDREAFASEHPEWEPQLRDHFDVVARIERMAGVADTDRGALEATVSVAGGDAADPDTATVVREPAEYGSAIPESIGRFAVRREIGRGGMGIVLLAHDSKLDRLVALKVPLVDRVNGEYLERFEREARAMARFRHPRVCPVYDVGDVDGIPFIAMAYVEGEPLSARLRRDPPDARETARLIGMIAEGLAEAHERGLVHRDLKPGNVMLDERGEPVVMDFGLVHGLDVADTSRLTIDGAVMGTPAYMSPEQAGGEIERIGPATDVFALGVMLYQLLAGRLPFEGNLQTVLRRIREEDVPDPRDLDPAVPAPLADLCRAMTTRDLDARPAMDDVRAAIEAYLAGTAAPTIPGRRTARPNWWLVALGSVLAVLLLGAVITVRTTNGVVYLELDPPDATVRVDGEVATVTSPSHGKAFRVSVPRDAHTLTVERDGFRVESRDLSFLDKFGRRLRFQLRPLPDDEPKPSTTIDPAKPPTAIASIPGWRPARGQVGLMGDKILLRGRGSLVSTESFEAPFEMRLKWFWKDGEGIYSDILSVGLHTDGEHHAERPFTVKDSYVVLVNAFNGETSVENYDPDRAKNVTVAKGRCEPLERAIWRDLRIVDDGETISVFVDNEEEPTVTAKVADRGEHHRIVVYNREPVSFYAPTTLVDGLEVRPLAD